MLCIYEGHPHVHPHNYIYLVTPISVHNFSNDSFIKFIHNFNYPFNKAEKNYCIFMAFNF